MQEEFQAVQKLWILWAFLWMFSARPLWNNFPHCKHVQCTSRPNLSHLMLNHHATLKLSFLYYNPYKSNLQSWKRSSMKKIDLPIFNPNPANVHVYTFPSKFVFCSFFFQAEPMSRTNLTLLQSMIFFHCF